MLFRHMSFSTNIFCRLKPVEWELEFFNNADQKINLSDLTMTFTNLE